MLASSKLMPISVEVESNHVTGVPDGDILSTNSMPACHTLVHHTSIHQQPIHRLPKMRHAKRIPPKSPDLIELSDAGPSPVSGLEDDSSPGVTDADSEDPHSMCDTESPTPTNSEANTNAKNYWHSVEEHRELLATEGEDDEDEDDHPSSEDHRKSVEELVEINSSDSEVGTSANQSSDSDGGNNSYNNDTEDIDEEELWKISSEQMTYYKGQFKTLQPDPNGLIGGAQAKQFFEKSRLPISELSRIWQLSDVTKDGALSLSEFCTAMHLVVLRRNNIALPKQLPPVLEPPNLQLAVAATATQSENANVSKPVATNAESGAGNSQHWTKFVDSPTGSLASPGPRPVNFDFKRAQVEQDPRILHPVALRLTPESQSVDLSSSSGPAGPVSLPPSTTSSALLTNSAISTNLGTPLGGKKEPPPPPPPRPYRGHARSSSLDLNQLGGGRNSGLYPTAPPAVPPRVSPSMGSPRKENEVSQASGGAFQVYRRPVGVTSGASSASDKKQTAGTSSVTAKGLTSVIEDYQRRGEVLRKQQLLLTKQLADIQEEKASLELRLQRLNLTDSHA